MARIIGRKAAGLAVLPADWTPPFAVIEADLYERWRTSAGQAANSIIDAVADLAAAEARKWPAEWDRGVTVRSSATDETLSERGANQSVELAADYDGAMVSRAIKQVYESFASSGATGAMAVIVQARVACIALGHISNEQRVSKTINQWVWEYEPPDLPGGRFNSQRDTPPNQKSRLSLSGDRSRDLTKLFRKIGRWCSKLAAGRTHLEWGATTESLWLFQLDFESDQPDSGVDPTEFLRAGDFRPPGELPAGSPFQVAPKTGATGWSKIDKVATFVGADAAYPSLIFVTGDDFVKARAAGRNLEKDLEAFARGRIVCRTDCRSTKVSNLNLPRTHTVTSAEAIAFIGNTVDSYCAKSVSASDLCFILHKFIPSVTAAWAVARKGETVVRVDSLWGLPDGLQYLPHDSFEFDVKRGHPAERTRYKNSFLQETESGAWEVVRISRKSGRWRSLPAPDLEYVARRTQDIADRTGNDVQVMWFCQIPEETGLPRNIPWFSMEPVARPSRDYSVSPQKRPYTIRSMDDLRAADALAAGQFVLQLDPDDPELFRSPEFLDSVIEVARRKSFPVSLMGSILGHAFYVLEKAGLSVTALSEQTRTRTRQKRVFRKLVRDAIPTRISEGGEAVTLAEIAKSEARAALVGKLFEESHELLAADTPADVTAELADVLEVVRALAHATGIDWSDVQSSADAKRQSRGGFEKSVVLLETSSPGWVQSHEQKSSVIIPLSRLTHVSEDGQARTIPFPLLLAQGSRPIIRLQDGTELEIEMSGSGIRISPAGERSHAEEQLSFDL